MKIEIFQIDAFTHKVFGGNPAAVCPLNEWLSDELLQNIAFENNLSETAFFVARDEGYDLRWFTPTTEVDLCGHATLAAAWVLKYEIKGVEFPVKFSTRSGDLFVGEKNGEFTLNFPIQEAVPCVVPSELLAALGLGQAKVLAAEDYLVVIEDESILKNLSPDISKLRGLPLRGVIVTSPGTGVDFVSRWFGPNVGVTEDPVTGSAHTTLAPYWSKRLGKNALSARQISQRGGDLYCKIEGGRVFISGSAVKFMQGYIFIEDQ